MAEDTRYRCHVRTARDHQAGSGVAQAVDIELLSVDIPPLQGAALAAPFLRRQSFSLFSYLRSATWKW